MSYKPREYWSKRRDPNSLNTNTNNFLINREKKFIKQSVLGCKKILDIGPGDGRLIDAYVADDKNITFVDIITTYKKKLESKYYLLTKNDLNHVIVNNIKKLNIFNNDEFEVGICTHVLLHVPDKEIESTIKELTRVCKKLVCIAVDNTYKPPASVKHVFCHNYEKISKNLDLNFIEVKIDHDSRDSCQNKSKFFIISQSKINQ